MNEEDSNIDRLKFLTERLTSRQSDIEEARGKLEDMYNKFKYEKEFFQCIIDCQPNLIFVKDVNSRFILVNESVCRIYGLTKKDIVGKSEFDLNNDINQVNKFHKNDTDVIYTMKTKIIDCEPVTDYRGITRFYKTQKIPLISHNGTCDKLLGIATDITSILKINEEDAILSYKSQL